MNRPQTRTSRQPVRVIPKLANLLDEYRASMGDPTTGAMFHNGSGESMDMDKLAQRVIRPAVEAIGLLWFGWHGFRRGIASNLLSVGRSCGGFSVTPSHTSPKTVTSRLLIQRCWKRLCSGCKPRWTCWQKNPVASR